MCFVLFRLCHTTYYYSNICVTLLSWFLGIALYQNMHNVTTAQLIKSSIDLLLAEVVTAREHTIWDCAHWPPISACLHNVRLTWIRPICIWEYRISELVSASRHAQAIAVYSGTSLIRFSVIRFWGWCVFFTPMVRFSDNTLYFPDPVKILSRFHYIYSFKIRTATLKRADSRQEKFP